ncbi:hypothetical protein PEC301877_26380 [Pectobacterium carotovorum subsp. carotovorum]|nr:hypothetical protein PEC301877_26380 [Pectobacterium carotovorum subsp. carotovorum]
MKITRAKALQTSPLFSPACTRRTQAWIAKSVQHKQRPLDADKLPHRFKFIQDNYPHALASWLNKLVYLSERYTESLSEMRNESLELAAAV